MNTIYAECGSDRHQAIIKTMNACGDAAETADHFGITKASVQRIVRTAKKLEAFELTLTDGQTTLPVAQVHTSRGFLHACKAALNTYSGTFSNLELPNWKFVAGGQCVSLADLKSSKNQE